MVVFAGIVVILVLAVYLFMQGPAFGGRLSRQEQTKIKQSPNYREGAFKNLHHTPDLTEGASMMGVLWKFIFQKHPRKTPAVPLPTQKTDLIHLEAGRNWIVWFGHSSYFLQLDGKTILVDPVFSGHAAPVRFSTKSFSGTDIYSVKDFPPIDYLIITHNHYDHLDYPTIRQLKPKVRKVITSLGVSSHFENWGYDKHIILENDWRESLKLDDGFEINTCTARHFSGRTLKRNQTLWASFVLQTPTKRIFIGGDSGYDTHFADIGNSFGPFDLALLENGQYNENWKYIHMFPEQTVQAAIDLKAKKLLPVHWGKFALSIHPWDEPILRLTKEADRKNLALVHPLIGQAVDLDAETDFPDWWVGIN